MHSQRKFFTMMKWSSLPKVWACTVQIFKYYNLFLRNLLSFCEQDHFDIADFKNILKQQRLQEVVSKFMPKYIYGTCSSCHFYIFLSKYSHSHRKLYHFGLRWSSLNKERISLDCIQMLCSYYFLLVRQFH